MVLNQFEVPMYKEAFGLACKTHRFFYNVRAIEGDAGSMGKTLLQKASITRKSV